MPTIKHILGPMRIPFLALTPACVLLGIGTAVWQAGSVSTVAALLVFSGAVAAHISVNAFNEYFDFKSGLDLRTRRTPFSGGSGTLPENPDAARTTLVTAWASFTVTAVIGLIFLLTRGSALLPLALPWSQENAERSGRKWPAATVLERFVEILQARAQAYAALSQP